MCTRDELLAKEWGGSKNVLDHLPTEYFSTGSINLSELDYLNVFKKGDPRYWKVIGETLDDDTASKLVADGGSESILVLLNLMQYKSKSDKDLLAKKIVRYVQKSVVDCYFEDYLATSTVNELISGTISQEGLEVKRNAHPMQGGAPWLSSKTPLFETTHIPTKFNKLNTGIYDKDELRSTYLIEGQKNTSSVYTVFAYNFEDVE